MMTPEEITHMENTVMSARDTDAVWRKAFSYNNTSSGRKYNMSCRPCYMKVLIFCKSTQEKEISDLNDIDTSSKEGKLLMAAIAKITTEIHTDRTPGEVIGILQLLSNQMYKITPANG